MSLGPLEIAGIVVIVLLLFGGKKIPQLARDLGTGLREFKRSMSGAEKEITDVRHEIEEDNEPAETVKKATRSSSKKKKTRKA
ncbi:MAG: twin-arginine translocase TatA/TatE family subunit [bacterium]|nr:twin-arginine translocase TatA/TatE family subunit [bacterium]